MIHPTFRYRLFLFLELVVVLLIIGIFKFIEDRPIAGLIAGSVFLISTLLVIGIEWWAIRKMTWALGGALLFLLGAVIPIFILRLSSWGIPFDEASLLGVSGGVWHKASNYLYLLMLAGIFISLQRARLIRTAKNKSPR